MFRKLIILLMGIGLYMAWQYEMPNVSAPTSIQVESEVATERATDAPKFASQYAGHDWYLVERGGD
ncbi:hypothetical protein QJS77_14805, partial [Enterococcus faecium]